LGKTGNGQNRDREYRDEVMFHACGLLVLNPMSD
jgi:hypothetical protein